MYGLYFTNIHIVIIKTMHDTNYTFNSIMDTVSNLILTRPCVRRKVSGGTGKY